MADEPAETQNAGAGTADTDHAGAGTNIDARADTHAGETQNTARDSAHDDSAHSDSAHSDSAHSDSAHSDSAHSDSRGATADRTRDEPVVRKQRRAVFRVPLTSLLTIPILLFCITPVAFTVPGLQALYLIPVAIVVWVVRVRTTATPQGLSARTLTSTHSVPWEELSGLAVTKKAGVQAVRTDGTTVPLPYTRLHHVPVLSLLSDGRVPDPSGALDDSPAPDSAESGSAATPGGVATGD